jgi:hypothetical protein
VNRLNPGGDGGLGEDLTRWRRWKITGLKELDLGNLLLPATYPNTGHSKAEQG